MNFLDYIKGNRKGREANRIERNSMRDPFLHDAIDGFDSVGGDHIARINAIRSRIGKKPAVATVVVRKRTFIWQAVAACGMVVLAFGAYMFISYQRSEAFAQAGRDLSAIEIYVPESFYEKNEIVIEEKNEILAEIYKPEIESFRIEDNMSAVVTREELDILSGDEVAVKNQDMMDLYVPESGKADIVESELMYSKSKGKTQPIGGFGKYGAYLKANKIQPTDGVCADRHGAVAIEFSIDESGQPFQFVVVQSLCGVSDKEAIRLIKVGAKWMPTNERVIVKIEF